MEIKKTGHQLNFIICNECFFIIFSGQITATVWALFLPPVTKTIYFHNEAEELMLSDNLGNVSETVCENFNKFFF